MGDTTDTYFTYNTSATKMEKVSLCYRCDTHFLALSRVPAWTTQPPLNRADPKVTGTQQGVKLCLKELLCRNVAQHWKRPGSKC